MSKFARAFGFFSLGLAISLVIGYWLKQEEIRRRQASSEPMEPNTPEKEHIVLTPKTPPMEQAADDLTRINGIGPKIAQALAQAGIVSYTQLVNIPNDQLLQQLQGVRGVSAEKIDNWKEQAAELIS